MKSVTKTKKQLIEEVVALHRLVAELEGLEAEHNRAEEVSPSEKERLLALMEALAKVGIGVDIVGTDYKVLFQNEALKRRFGDLTGKLCYEGYMGLKKPCDFCPMIKTIGSKKSEQVELTGVDGRDYELLANPLVNLDGTVDKVVEVVVDITEHRRIEEILKGSEEKLHLMFESLAEGITVTDLETNIVQVNEATIHIHGYDNKEELIGQSILKLITDKDHARAMENLKKILAEGRCNGRTEYRLTRRDGSEFPAELSTSVFKDISGKPIGFITIVTDITERKRAEEALKESEERYRALLELGAEVGESVIMLQDTERGLGTQTFFSNEWPRITGYSKEELIGTSFFDLVHPKHRKASVARHRRKMHGEVMPGLFEIPIIKKDGTEVPIELTSAYTTYEGERGNVCYARDITERKRAEEELKRAAEEWRATIDSITDLVSIHSSNFKLVRVNKAYADACKMKPKELIGKTCYEVLHGRKECMPDCPHRKTLEIKKPVTAEIFEPRLGSYLEVTTSPIFNEKGDVVASVHVARDITERKQMEGQLIVTDRLASVGELASGVAHELNNPLTSVIGFSQLLLDKDIPDEIKEDVNIIFNEARRSAAVVKNLLTFARKHAPVKQPVNINSIVEKVLELRAYERRVNNIQVNTRFATDLPEVMADYFQLQQVFLNITINAEYFMIEAHNRGTLTITTEKVGDIVRASFADDGPGIAPENLGHLFDPFFTTKEVGKGTGLGLSICHGIITEHGGRIYAESELGRGATFIAELPINDR